MSLSYPTLPTTSLNTGTPNTPALYTNQLVVGGVDFNQTFTVGSNYDISFNGNVTIATGKTLKTSVTNNNITPPNLVCYDTTNKNFYYTTTMPSSGASLSGTNVFTGANTFNDISCNNINMSGVINIGSTGKFGLIGNSIVLGKGATSGASIGGDFNIAIGSQAGYQWQYGNTLAIGYQSGYWSQNTQSCAIGYQAGYMNQSTQSTAIGFQAGQTTQGTQSVGIGYQAGNSNQGGQSVAIGCSTGVTSQGGSAVAIGASAGNSNQGSNGVAIGSSAGNSNQGGYGVGIGWGAGMNSQGYNSVAIGGLAGTYSQGTNAIAIGYTAGYNGQANNTIVLNATGATLNGVSAQTNSFYVAPIRNNNVTPPNLLCWDPTTKEVYYTTTMPSTSGATLSGSNVFTGTNSFSAVTTCTANLIVSGTNYLGVGTATPGYPIDIQTNTYSALPGSYSYYALNGTIYGTSTTALTGAYIAQSQNIGLNCAYVVKASGFLASSDERIKTNITELDSNTSINYLRNMRPVTYNFKDVLKNSNNLQYGFIAQDIESLIPSASTTSTEFIPSIFDMVTVTNQIITFQNFNTNQLEKDMSGNIFPKIKLYDASNNEIITTITNILDSSSCQIADTIDVGSCFCYGQQVNNSLSIDKNVIFTITTKAVQYLDKLVQTQQATIQDLQNQIHTITTRLSQAGI